MTSDSVVQFGIVGTGRMSVRMAQALSLSSGARLVAVASGSPERAKRFAEVMGIARAHSSVASLLADEAVDAVYVANATAEHAGTTLLALQAGKSVLCEKPLATNAADARAIEEAARTSGCLVVEAMWTLFLPAYRRVAEWVETQSEAGPLHLYADFGYPTSADEQARLFTPGPGAGVLLDRGVYTLALALKLLGAVGRIEGCLGLTAQGVDQDASLLLSHESGGVSQIAVSLRILLQNRAAVSSPAGLLTLEPPLIGAEFVRSFAAPRPRSAEDPLTGSVGRLGAAESLRRWPVLRRLNALRRSGRSEHQSFGADPYLPMLIHFCELARAGRSTSDVMPLATSTAVLTLVDQARLLPCCRTVAASTTDT